MARISTKLTNERRERVWELVITGHTPQSIIKTLGTTQTVVYNEFKFLTKESRTWMYSMAKGTHVLMYKKAIEGTNLVLAQCWNKFNDPSVPEKQKVSYLRLMKECNELIYELVANGPTEFAILDITRRAERLGIDSSKPMTLTDEQQIQQYINHSINAYPNDIDVDSNNNLADFDFGNRRDKDAQGHPF